MASKFRSASKTAVGVGLTPVYTLELGTGQSDKQPVLVGITLCNITAAAINASVKIDRPAVSLTVAGQNPVSTEDVWLCKNIPIPAGSSLEIMSGNKVVLAYNVASGAGDTVQAQSSTSSSLDVILSYMEIS